MPNKPRADVRYHAARAARSRRALLDALAELLHEQSFGKITVQDLLRRAHVGRATFYAHFQDKDDLLLTSFVRMLEAMTRQLDAEPPGSPRWVPVTEFFEHVRSARPLLQMFEESGRLPIMWRLATLHFARSIEPRAGSAFVARFLAGALIEVLQWWLEAREPPAARTVERDFHALAHAVVRSAR
ncbi:MAG TPA: TetR family transcriptional regulator [Planctomycetota bacterium]|nr:TetR family transcriptional regulator [Planctomycetota bacterium]